MGAEAPVMERTYRGIEARASVKMEKKAWFHICLRKAPKLGD